MSDTCKHDPEYMTVCDAMGKAIRDGTVHARAVMRQPDKIRISWETGRLSTKIEWCPFCGSELK